MKCVSGCTFLFATSLQFIQSYGNFSWHLRYRRGETGMFVSMGQKVSWMSNYKWCLGSDGSSCFFNKIPGLTGQVLGLVSPFKFPPQNGRTWVWVVYKRVFRYHFVQLKWCWNYFLWGTGNFIENRCLSLFRKTEKSFCRQSTCHMVEQQIIFLKTPV